MLKFIQKMILNSLKKDMETDSPYYEFTGTQTTKDVFISRLESDLLHDGFACSRDFFAGSLKIDLYAAKKNFSFFKDSVSRTVFVIRGDSADLKAMKGFQRAILEYLKTSKEKRLKAECRPGIVLFVTSGADAKIQEYMKEVKYYDKGILFPVCLDFASKRLYFKGSKSDFGSDMQYAQKFTAKYVMGYKDGRLPRNKNPLSDEQMQTISGIEDVMNMDYKELKREAKEENERMFACLKDHEFRIKFDDQKSGDLYYKENDQLMDHPFYMDEEDPKHLILWEYETLSWVYPHHKDMRETERSGIIQKMEKYLSDNGYTLEQDF